MKDRVANRPGQYQAVISPRDYQLMQNGKSFAITLTRDDDPIEEGTPYNKASVLPDSLAAALCPRIANPTPADALRNLLPRYLSFGIDYGSSVPTSSATGKLFFVEDDTADYVIAQGTSGPASRYRKWASGKAEFWTTFFAGQLMGEEGSQTWKETLPFELICNSYTCPCIMVTLSNNLNVTTMTATMSDIKEDRSDSFTINLIHSGALNGAIKGYVHIIGDWKLGE